MISILEPLDPPFDDFVPRSVAEATFLLGLLQGSQGLDRGWGDYPWLSVTLTEVRNGVAADDARLDFDGLSIRGGYDRSGLQDLGTPIEQAQVDLGPPDGIVMMGEPAVLAHPNDQLIV